MRGFFGRDWPWALSALGLWAPMLFDVSGYYPGYLALAFLPLGALWKPQASKGLGLLGGLLAGLLALYWYWPCQGTGCATRHLFFPPYTAQAVATAIPEEKASLLQEARRRYRLAPWPLTLAYAQAKDPGERLALARELAKRFPLARESFYELWVRSALEAGHREEAREALAMGLKRFPSSPRLRALAEAVEHK